MAAIVEWNLPSRKKTPGDEPEGEQWMSVRAKHPAGDARMPPNHTRSYDKGILPFGQATVEIVLDGSGIERARNMASLKGFVPVNVNHHR